MGLCSISKVRYPSSRPLSADSRLEPTRGQRASDLLAVLKADGLARGAVAGSTVERPHPTFELGNDWGMDAQLVNAEPDQEGQSPRIAGHSPQTPTHLRCRCALSTTIWISRS